MNTITKIYILNKAKELILKGIYKVEIIEKAKKGIEKLDAVADGFWDKLREYVRKEKEIVTSLNTNKKSKLRYSLSLPSDFFKIFESFGLKRSFLVFAEIEDNKLKLYLPNPLEIEKKVFLYKVNKGGIGKTFLTAQTGHGLALLGKKTLILTSDSQNNILNFMSKEKVEVKKGLIRAVLNDEDNIINLR